MNKDYLPKHKVEKKRQEEINKIKKLEDETENLKQKQLE